MHSILLNGDLGEKSSALLVTELGRELQGRKRSSSGTVSEALTRKGETIAWYV